MTSLFLDEQNIAVVVATPFVGADVLSIERFRGVMNHVFHITGQTCSVIVRISQEPNLESALTEHRRELWCLEQARKHGIPGPEILASGQLANRAYMVYPFIPGHAGDQQTADLLDVYRQLGHYARIFHAIPVDDAGQQLLHHDVGTLEVLQRQIRYNIASLGEEDALVQLGVYNMSSRDDIARRLDSLFRVNFRFGLCHKDPSPRNMVIADSGQSYILDWGCATIAAIPHQDSYELLIDMMEDITETGEIDMAYLQAFISGYGMETPEAKQFLIELEAYALLRAFDVVRWALARQPFCILALAQRARKVWEHIQLKGFTNDGILASAQRVDYDQRNHH